MNQPLIQGLEFWYEEFPCHQLAAKLAGCIAIATGAERPVYCHDNNRLEEICPYFNPKWAEEFDREDC